MAIWDDVKVDPSEIKRVFTSSNLKPREVWNGEGYDTVYDNNLICIRTTSGEYLEFEVGVAMAEHYRQLLKREIKAVKRNTKKAEKRVARDAKSEAKKAVHSQQLADSLSKTLRDASTTQVNKEPEPPQIGEVQQWLKQHDLAANISVKISQLSQLHRSGVLSDERFEAAKAQILGIESS